MTPTSDERQRDPAWVALGQAVVNRRVELGMRTREAFAAKVEISTKILGEIERGDRTSYDPATLAAVEQALEWPAGHIRMLLAKARRGLPLNPAEVQPLGGDAADVVSAVAGLLADGVLDPADREAFVILLWSAVRITAARAQREP